MHRYTFIGEDFVDKSIPESAFTFNYIICADSLFKAREMFYTIFPTCNIVKCRHVEECRL